MTINYSNLWQRMKQYFPSRNVVHKAESPLVKGDNAKKEVRISIRQTKQLHSRNGRSPERTVAEYVSNALDRADHNYYISFDHDVVSVSSQKSTCGENSAFGEWDDYVSTNSVDGIAKDSNILLTDSRGGGCGYIGGNVATTPGKHITTYESYKARGTGPLQRNVHANLHELAHNLGAQHDHDSDRFGKQHPGMGWNEDGKWHRTPTVAGNGAPNYCGEEIEERQHSLDDGVRHQYYHDCFVNEVLSVE